MFDTWSQQINFCDGVHVCSSLLLQPPAPLGGPGLLAPPRATCPRLLSHGAHFIGPADQSVLIEFYCSYIYTHQPSLMAVR